MIRSDVQAVLFDFDDTLVKTFEVKCAQHRFVAKQHYSIDLDDDTLRDNWGKPLPELVRTLYRTSEIKEACAHVYRYNPRFPKVLDEHTLPTLSRLKAANKSIGIVTSTTRPSLNLDLEKHVPLSRYIDYCQTAEDTTLHKPHPEVFSPAIKWLGSRGLRTEQATYVGDGLHDMIAARGAGIPFIGVTTGLVAAEEFARHGANWVSDLSML